MKQLWVLQGRSGYPAEWLDLFTERRIKDLPGINAVIAKQIGASYRIVLKYR